MHLPWTQLDKDAREKCGVMANLLRIPRAHAVGIADELFAWTLLIAPDSDFSGRVPDIESIAAAVGWPVDDAPRLVRELQRVGFVETAPVLRVRGLDRYRRTWEKNHGKRGNAPESGYAVPETGTNPAQTGAKTAPQTQTQTHIEATTLSSELDEPPPASFAVVFGHWQRVMDKPDAKPIDKRRRAVAARLREGYTVEQLKQAIDGCARTPHNIGQNEQHKRFDELELICRNGAQVERFVANATGPPAAAPSSVKFLESAERKNLYGTETG